MDISSLFTAAYARLFCRRRVRSVDPLLDTISERQTAGFILMIPPQCDVASTLDKFLRFNRFTKYVEIEEKAGCRRFRFT